MKQLWNRLSNSGVAPDQPYVLVRRIRMQNQISLLFIIILIFFAVVNITNNKISLVLVEVSFAFLLFIPTYLNQKKLFTLSSILFFIELFAFALILCFILAPHRELEYMFLMLAILPLTSYKSRRIIYSLFVLSYIAFVFAKTYTYGPLEFVEYLNYGFIFLITFFMVKYLKDEFETNVHIIARQNDQLKKLNVEKNQLISIASHDLRSPLNRIQSLLSLLSIEGSLSPEQKSILQTAQREAKNQTVMIKEILDLYAMDEGTIKVNPEKNHIPTTLNKLVDDFKSVADKKNIIMHINHKTSETEITADSGYLRQVFENLLSNAIKFSYPNSAITIITQTTGQTMQISFKDEGQGLDPEDHKRLFKRFQKLSARPTGGEASSGLGLSIAKKFTEAMNGSLVCISEKGKGATFTVELPLAKKVE
ncbi:MAG: HAMP domain-containing sensor histidine kinase [Cyclobacteriaceae bacterium]